MWFALGTVAMAQEIPNGTFDGGSLAGWSMQSSTGSIDAFESASQGWVLRLVRDGVDRAIVCTDPFVVTRDRIGAVMLNQPSSSNPTSWWLADPTTHAVVLSEDEIPEFGAFALRTLATGPACGARLLLCLEPHDDGTAQQQVVQVDDVALDGVPCEESQDGDLDGSCPVGQDLDGDQACLGVDEVDLPGDCDDGDPDRAPGRTETCDGVDEDCDGVADQGLPTEPWYPDVDADGFGDGDGIPVEGCGPPAGYAAPGDCDDHRSDTHPGAVDDPGDGVDQDCDGADAVVPDRDGSADPDAPVGCGCATGASPGGLALVLLLAGLRARRHPQGVRDLVHAGRDGDRTPAAGISACSALSA